jgi:hypothetical protein
VKIETYVIVRGGPNTSLLKNLGGIQIKIIMKVFQSVPLYMFKAVKILYPKHISGKTTHSWEGIEKLSIINSLQFRGK